MKLWTLCAGASALALAALAPARAEQVAITNTPLVNAIEHLDKMYGVTIVLRGNLANYPNKRVTLTADDSGSPASRFQAVTDLANSLGANVVKGFVVTKSAESEPVTSPKIDSYQKIVFAQATVPVADAIRKVAELDGATAQIAKDVTGNVTFPSTQMTASDAASEIARQAHLNWKPYYALTTEPGAVASYVTYFAPKPAPEPTPAVTTPRPGQPTTPPNGAVPIPYPYPAYGQTPYGYPPYASYDPTSYFVMQNGYGYAGGIPYPTQQSGLSPGGFSLGNGSVNVMGGSPYYGGGGTLVLP